MSKTAFSNIERCAIWTSYKQNCFYCNQLIDWNSLNIDHLIPEFIVNIPKRFEQLKVDYGLEKNFDINGLYNLVPTHSKCNSRKSDLIFDKRVMLFYLAISKQKAPLRVLFLRS